MGVNGAQDVTANVSTQNLIKAIAMIQGSMKATIHFDDTQMAMTIVPMIKTIWDSLNNILKTRFNEKDLIVSTCTLIRSQIDIIVKSKDLQ